MPMIDIQTAIAWAKARWPSPVVRRPVDDLLAHCPRVEGELLVQCKDCKGTEPLGEHVLRCAITGELVFSDDDCGCFAGKSGGMDDER